MRPTAATALAAALLLAAGTAAAQPIYRCGSEYTRTPCPGGRSVETTADAPSARDRAAAERRLVADQRRAAAMTAARERREAAPRARPANVGPAAPAASAVDNLKPPRRAKGKVRVVRPDDFTVRAPAPKPKP